MAMVDDVLHHSPVQIQNPGGRPPWVLYASSSQTVRLIVFVHGFGLDGKAVKAWNEFAHSGMTSDWWRSSDMLFVGYSSSKEHPEETARWLRERLQDFYPTLQPEHLRRRDASVRAPSSKGYEELLLVGHSLGGLVIRCALHQQARIWAERLEQDSAAVRPSLLDAKVRLFSPASAGFQPTRRLGLLKASLLGDFIEFCLSASPAYKALEQGSPVLTDVREGTERLVDAYGDRLTALRARIVWARPESVVLPQGYKTDYEPESLIPERDHKQVCKPHTDYEEPRRFVATGSHR